MTRSMTFRRSAALLFVAACGRSGPWQLVPRPVTGLPEQFVANAPSPAGAEAGACRTPLRDARDGTLLTLVRSTRGRGEMDVAWGDYAVSPAGRYGVQVGELLRVECGSGQPVGKVPRNGS